MSPSDLSSRKESAGIALDWDRFRILLEVSRTKQIHGAARRLGLNHATVSRNLSALERSLGTKLITRDVRGCEITEAGKAWVVAAERAESAFLQASADRSSASEEISGVVRVGAPDGVGNYLLADALGSLAAKYPGLLIQLIPLPRTFSLSHREADIAITLERPEKGHLIVTKIADYSLSVYAAASYLRRLGEPKAQRDISSHLFISHIDDLVYSKALHYAAALKRSAPRRYECGSISAQLEAVKAGHGLAVLHDYVAIRFPELKRVLSDVRYVRSYWMLSHPDTHASMRVSVVRAHVISAIRSALRII